MLSGQGKLSKELSQYTNNLIFSFIQYMKDYMSYDQLKKSMQLIIKNILDPTVPINLKNTLIFSLYRLDEDITRAQKSSLVQMEIQMEILESLVLLCKDLKNQFKCMVEEINQMKNDNSQQKSNIKWMNDRQQKQMSLKELFKLEDGIVTENCLILF